MPTERRTTDLRRVFGTRLTTNLCLLTLVCVGGVHIENESKIIGKLNEVQDTIVDSENKVGDESADVQRHLSDVETRLEAIESNQ